MSNNIEHYNNIKTFDKPLTFNEVVNDNRNEIHKSLYEDALSTYIKKNHIVKSMYKFIEIKPKIYTQASSVLQILNDPPYTRTVVSLDKYWNKYQTIKNFDKTLSDLYIDEDTVKDAEIIYIDYINGKAKLKSRYTGVEFWADFKYITNNTKYADNMLVDRPTTTFKQIYLSNGLNGY